MTRYPSCALWEWYTIQDVYLQAYFWHGIQLIRFYIRDARSKRLLILFQTRISGKVRNWYTSWCRIPHIKSGDVAWVDLIGIAGDDWVMVENKNKGARACAAIKWVGNRSIKYPTMAHSRISLDTFEEHFGSLTGNPDFQSINFVRLINVWQSYPAQR